jgi:probable addiction module antidote protein
VAKRKAKPVTSRFDAADYLDSREVVVEYLSAAIQDKNPDVFLQAVSDVAKARGIARVAREAGLGRESLYKALSPGSKVRYDTVRRLLNSLGVTLTVASR